MEYFSWSFWRISPKQPELSRNYLKITRRLVFQIKRDDRNDTGSRIRKNIYSGKMGHFCLISRRIVIEKHFVLGEIRHFWSNANTEQKMSFFFVFSTIVYYGWNKFIKNNSYFFEFLVRDESQLKARVGTKKMITTNFYRTSPISCRDEWVF